MTNSLALPDALTDVCRYRLEERWVLVEDAPAFAEHADLTHGICEDCVAGLRASGMSV